MIYQGDCLEVMKGFDDNSVNMILTSPPYWALRDYGVEGQLGLEPTFNEYINKLCDMFDECKRVLRDDGTCWVNIGDTYSGSNGNGYKQTIENENIFKGKAGYHDKLRNRIKEYSLPSKSLCLIPHRFAIEMCNRGWILRNTIIWHKNNCMPSSVKDRFTVDFEYLFFFSKKKKYYFEQQFDEYTEPLNRWGGNNLNANGESSWDKGTGQETYRDRNMRPNQSGRNKRCVWNINTKPFKEAHFAVFPEELCVTPIKAGCPEGGIVLDPFFGAGTTGLVATKLNREYIGIELNPEYIEIARKRIENEHLR